MYTHQHVLIRMQGGQVLQYFFFFPGRWRGIFVSAKPEDFGGGRHLSSATQWLTPKKQRKESHGYFS